MTKTLESIEDIPLFNQDTELNKLMEQENKIDQLQQLLEEKILAFQTLQNLNLSLEKKILDKDNEIKEINDKNQSQILLTVSLHEKLFKISQENSNLRKELEENSPEKLIEMQENEDFKNYLKENYPLILEEWNRGQTYKIENIKPGMKLKMLRAGHGGSAGVIREVVSVIMGTEYDHIELSSADKKSISCLALNHRDYGPWWKNCIILSDK